MSEPAVPPVDPLHSVGEACEQFGRILGLDEPVPEAVLRAALENDAYARYLLASRNARPVLDILMAHPPAAVATPSPPPSRSNRELLWQAARSFGRWTRTGFARVDEENYRRRFQACQRCDQLVDPPDRAIYKLAPAGGGDRRICAACGCIAANTARLASESCPLPDLRQPHLTRWGEPMPLDPGQAASAG